MGNVIAHISVGYSELDKYLIALAMYHRRSTIQLIQGLGCRVAIWSTSFDKYIPAFIFTSLGAFRWVNKSLISFISARYHWKSLQGLTPFKCVSQNHVSVVFLKKISSYVSFAYDLSSIG